MRAWSWRASGTAPTARIFEVAGDETSPEAYLRTLTDAAAKGVVGVVDLEYGEALDAWPDRLARGADVLRVRRGVYADGLEHTIAAGLRSGDPLVEGQQLLTMGPLKIISDGSLNTRRRGASTRTPTGPAPGRPTRPPTSSAR